MHVHPALTAWGRDVEEVPGNRGWAAMVMMALMGFDATEVMSGTCAVRFAEDRSWAPPQSRIWSWTRPRLKHRLANGAMIERMSFHVWQSLPGDTCRHRSIGIENAASLESHAAPGASDTDEHQATILWCEWVPSSEAFHLEPVHPCGL